MNERLGLTNIDPYVGKYYSVEYVRKRKFSVRRKKKSVKSTIRLKKKWMAVLLLIQTWSY